MPCLFGSTPAPGGAFPLFQLRAGAAAVQPLPTSPPTGDGQIAHPTPSRPRERHRPRNTRHWSATPAWDHPVAPLPTCGGSTRMRVSHVPTHHTRHPVALATPSDTNLRDRCTLHRCACPSRRPAPRSQAWPHTQRSAPAKTVATCLRTACVRGASRPHRSPVRPPTSWTLPERTVPHCLPQLAPVNKRESRRLRLPPAAPAAHAPIPHR